MSKPYTKDDFSNQIYTDRVWRIREISNLRSSIQLANEAQKVVLLRAMVAICYAHWEGSVKFTAKKFMQHVALRRLPYSTLESQFLRNLFIPRFSQMHKKRYNLEQSCELVDEVRTADSKKFSHLNEALIDTKSNLNFKVLSDICVVCGIDPTEFSQHRAFIDVFLLKRRNEIAHGEETAVDIKDLDKLKDTTISIIRQFGDLLENRLVLEEYKVA